MFTFFVAKQGTQTLPVGLQMCDQMKRGSILFWLVRNHVGNVLEGSGDIMGYSSHAPELAEFGWSRGGEISPKHANARHHAHRSRSILMTFPLLNQVLAVGKRNKTWDLSISRVFARCGPGNICLTGGSIKRYAVKASSSILGGFDLYASSPLTPSCFLFNKWNRHHFSCSS